MIAIEDFTRYGNCFFTFIYIVGNIQYRSGVMFKTACSDEDFKKTFPMTQNTLLWLEQNIESINMLVENNLPPQADLAVFKEQQVVSFSLIINENHDPPEIHLAYGGDGVYLTATIIDKQLDFVGLNEYS
ncbi:hypothetical protein GCM10023310_30970 [Paenibacillus vulneris]|uniref:DUF2004 domain-containing protein n=1 Tax=Paenibacillus vulneris TaxID=1133364 RepID=A0ABW3UTF6_9BACL|nr:hypothetical protein [Paenibacillus sp. 32352]